MARIGDVLVEPGQQIEFLATSADSGGQLVRCRIRMASNRPAPPEHSHPNQTEQFTVERGRLGYLMGDARLEAAPGQVVVVPPGTNHTFWSAGGEELEVVAEVRPALRFEDFAETIHTLIRTGRIPAGGRRPNPLVMAVVAHTYRREWRLTKLSRVARAALPILALVGGLAGYKAHYSAQGESRDSNAPAAV